MEQRVKHHYEKETEALKSDWPVYRRRIHVYETDKDGVVHFSNYLRMAEEATFVGFRAIGFPIEDAGNSMAMSKTNVNYYHAMEFGGNVDVILVDIKATRVRIFLEFDLIADGVVCSKIQFTFACINIEERKAFPLDTRLRNCIAAMRTQLPESQTS